MALCLPPDTWRDWKGLCEGQDYYLPIYMIALLEETPKGMSKAEKYCIQSRYV